MNYKNTFSVFFLLIVTAGYINAQTEIKKPNLKDHIIDDDLVVNGGGTCLGDGCQSGMGFGDKTLVLKSRDIKILFDDISSFLTYPSENWQIQINEESLTGRDAFILRDQSTELFTVEASNKSHALYIDGDGDIGLGTDTPDRHLQITDGDTPVLRLEQDGSSGFSPQTWDVGGNEVNFFIREDTTSSGRGIFSIKPGAPAHAIVIDGNGRVGLGTDAPQYSLHLEGDLGMTGGIYGISDQRLKEELESLDDALDLIDALHPRKYRFHNTYDGKYRKLPTGTHYGFFAQELQEVLPELVTKFEKSADENASSDDLLSINYVELIPILVKGIQELQESIHQLENEVAILRTDQRSEAK